MAEDAPATDAGTPTLQHQAPPNLESTSDPSGATHIGANGARSDSTPTPHGDSPVGRQAVRVFRSARRRRLAMPVHERPRLSRGLVAELVARGWDVPAELRPAEATSIEESENPAPHDLTP